MSIVSAFVASYGLLFVTRLIVASAGISFVVGIQHVAQWFESHEMGVAQGIYAGTGNAGAGVGAIVLPRIYGTDFQSAFLHLGVGALIIAIWYYYRGVRAKSQEKAEEAKKGANWQETLKVWSQAIAIALMLAYAMSFGLEIAMNSWLPGYYAEGFKGALKELGFEDIATIQIAAGTFAAVQSFNASLFRPFAGYMSDLFQRKNLTPFPFLNKEHPYAPRIHWLMLSLVLITLMMGALSWAGVAGILPVSVVVLAFFGICVSFATGGVFGLVPCLFKDRPGVATGFIGGVSCTGGIIYPLVYGFVPNIHMGYAYVALFILIPFMIFYAYTFRRSAPLREKAEACDDGEDKGAATTEMKEGAEKAAT
jgi:NNP family nitrate/nitrite transporter-like MFS transporter